jgi:WD40 repeat protein
MISPCGNYIVGGGASGSFFVWSALGGALLRAVKAHYRSITSMAWSDCASFLATGGADGMVHVFSLLDLVERESRQTVSPIRTWSVHHMPVTALLTMPSGRMISSSEDGQVVMMELFSQKVVFTIQMPHAIRALAHCSGRLFAGGMQGIIYLIDLDQYAVQQTAQLGVTVKHVLRVKTHQDQVLSSDRSKAYKTELLGHEKPITSLAILSEDHCEWLISGDEAGEVRIWDLESRGCVRVIRPWAHSATATATVDTSKTATSPTKQALHPVTSILIVPQDDEADKHESSFGSFGARTKEGKTWTDVVNLISPLQRYADRQDDGADRKSAWTPVPFLQPKRGRVVSMNRDNLFTYTALQSQSSK